MRLFEFIRNDEYKKLILFANSNDLETRKLVDPLVKSLNLHKDKEFLTQCIEYMDNNTSLVVLDELGHHLSRRDLFYFLQSMSPYEGRVEFSYLIWKNGVSMIRGFFKEYIKKI